MKESIEKVYIKIHPYISRTALNRCETLESSTGGRLFLKMENEQITGSFKLRGVLSKFSELSEKGINFNQVVAASTGNHALAVCHAAKHYQCTPIIFVPETISKSKLAKLVKQGVEIHQVGQQSGETEQLAIKWAREQQIPLVHPYNDAAVIAGQGTIALELIQQLPPLDSIYVPVGGGGLISGIAGYLKESNPSVRIVGVQPKNACEMANSIEQGSIVEPSKLFTISDGTAGGLDPDTVTYNLCRDLVDEFIRVEENEIMEALTLIQQHLDIIVEPAAALALAGMIKSNITDPNENVVAVICGGNIGRKQYLNLVRNFY